MARFDSSCPTPTTNRRTTSPRARWNPKWSKASGGRCNFYRSAKPRRIRWNVTTSSGGGPAVRRIRCSPTPSSPKRPRPAHQHRPPPPPRRAQLPAQQTPPPRRRPERSRHRLKQAHRNQLREYLNDTPVDYGNVDTTSTHHSQLEHHLTIVRRNVGGLYRTIEPHIRRLQTEGGAQLSDR